MKQTAFHQPEGEPLGLRPRSRKTLTSSARGSAMKASWMSAQREVNPDWNEGTGSTMLTAAEPSGRVKVG